MSIVNRDGVINALGNNNSALLFDKQPLLNMVSGQLASLWRSTGLPAQGAIPAAAAGLLVLGLGWFAMRSPTPGLTSTPPTTE